MPGKIPWVALLIAAGVVEGLGDVAFKQWSRDSRTILFVVGALAYVVATMLWAPTLKSQDLYRMLGVFFCGNLILGTAIGIIGYGEELTVRTAAGIAAAITAIILLA